MKARIGSSRLNQEAIESILDVTKALAAPFDLHGMLQAVALSAQKLLRAERASVWLYDKANQEAYIEVASDLHRISVPVGVGLVGTCARDLVPLNVSDCYSDSRFNQDIDKQSGFVTRCALTLPMVDHCGDLVGVLQALNRLGGTFDNTDLTLGEALAAQCAIALSRVRMSEGLLSAELMRQEMDLASSAQRSSLPAAMPSVLGYAMHGAFHPAAQTGGDTYDLALLPQGLLVVLGDATGHGLAPALTVIQMHAMLRMAFRVGLDLETAFTQVNDQLSEVLPNGHFVTTFIGLLSPMTHRLRFLSGGQGPILHFSAAQSRCHVYKATSFPMGAMPIQALRPAVELTLSPGDWLVLLSDGIYESANSTGDLFGRARVEQLLMEHHQLDPASFADLLLAAVRDHAGTEPQADDITAVLVRRLDTEVD